MSCAAPSVNFCADQVHTPEPLVSRGAAREKIRDALRLHVGRGRRFSVSELSHGAGVPERAIEAALRPVDDENYRPLTLENLLSITKFLGAAFSSHFLELAGLGAFELMEGQPPLPRVLTSADPQEDVSEERKRLIRRLAELEGVQ
jgi:hypothetical protein